LKRRQPERDGARPELRADGLQTQFLLRTEERHCPRRNQHGYNRPGNTFDAESRPEADEQDTGKSQSQRYGMAPREVFPNPLQLMEKLAGRRRFGVDSKKINRLRRHDGNRDAGGKTARDRPRNEFDEVAHARKPHGNKKSSGHHRSQDQAGVAVFLDNQQNDRNEGRRRTADLYAASTKAGNHQTGKNRREQPERRRRVMRASACQRGCWQYQGREPEEER